MSLFDADLLGLVGEGGTAALPGDYPMEYPGAGGGIGGLISAVAGVAEAVKFGIDIWHSITGTHDATIEGTTVGPIAHVAPGLPPLPGLPGYTPNAQGVPVPGAAGSMADIMNPHSPINQAWTHLWHPRRAHAPHRPKYECEGDPTAAGILQAYAGGQIMPNVARKMLRAIGCAPKRKRRCVKRRRVSICRPRRRRKAAACKTACAPRRRRTHRRRLTARQIAAGFGGRRRMR